MKIFSVNVSSFRLLFIFLTFPYYKETNGVTYNRRCQQFSTFNLLLIGCSTLLTFMQPFSPVIFELSIQSWLVVLWNNQKWPQTKRCFDTFDTSDTFDSSDSNERFWEIFANAEDRGQFTGENSGCAIKLIEFCNITFLMRSFKDQII